MSIFFYDFFIFYYESSFTSTQAKECYIKPTSTCVSGHHCLLIQAQRVAEEGIAFGFVENIVRSKECVLKAFEGNESSTN